jgi:hypothetical protein
MEVSLALLADCANISREGKLNIMGIFDRINAATVPAVHPQMQLIMNLEAERSEADRDHKLEVELIDADGNRMFHMEGHIKFGPPPPGERLKVNHIIQLNNLQFSRFGVHDFKILINNEVRKSVPLHILETKKEA